MYGCSGGEAEGPFVVENLRSRSERRSAKIFPYRGGVEEDLLYGGVESCPREGGGEALDISRDIF